MSNSKTTVTIKGRKLIIEMPLGQPKESKSGKSIVIATTSGILTTDAEFEGKPIKLGVNVFIEND